MKDIYHRLRKWLIKVNGTKKAENTILLEWDEVFFHPIITTQLVSSHELKHNTAHIQHRMYTQWLKWENLILYEDDDRLIRNKPVGIVAHEGNKHEEDITMNQLLELYMIEHHTNLSTDRPLSDNESTFKPSFAYRLDKDTSWVLVSAKTYPALQHINASIRNHDISKEYRALIVGTPDFKTIAKNYNYTFSSKGELTIDDPLFKWFNAASGRAQTFVNREKWVPSSTIISLIKTIYHPTCGSLSFIQCKLLTWRMHQIRAHLSHIWYPVVGDIQYGNPVVNRILYRDDKINRQLLHSYQYSFIDHRGKSIDIIASLPDDFERILQ